MTIVELFSKRFSMNGIDDWYVFLVHIVKSLASECMAHVNILIAVMLGRVIIDYNQWL